MSEIVRLDLAQQLQDLVDPLHEGVATGGDPAPLGIQWCVAMPPVALQALQKDGHPQFSHTLLPALPGARRMWAGGELRWHQPIRIGDTVTRDSTVSSIEVKEGRSGRLCFVEVTHSYSSERGVTLEERQDIVYKLGTAATPVRDPTPVPPSARRVLTLTTSTIGLFRYSALTGNAHRIHYDRPYATDVERYPALVVHGPWQATVLMHAAASLRAQPPFRFSYRSISPLYCGEDLSVHQEQQNKTALLWIACAEGPIGMKAEATWEQP
jgi:3-methylfumaryl-CoA hydratase